MTVKDQLKNTLTDVFGSSGWLVRQGGHHLPEQLEYAHAIADWMYGDASQPVALIEGDTGTGKTLGYLFPIVLNWVYSGEKAVIATHTIALQNQLMKGDLELVEDYLLDHDLPLPVFQQRLGMRHFVDPARVESIFDLDPNSVEKALFLEWARETAERGTGLLAEWQEQYGGLPEGIVETNVCITPRTAPGTSASYEIAKEMSAVADVVVTSHMVVLLEARKLVDILGMAGGDVRHLMFDEADQVPMVAEQLSSRRIQVREAIRTINDLVGHGSSHLDKVLRNASKQLQENEEALRNHGSTSAASEITLDESRAHSRVPESLSELIHSIQSVCAATRQSISRSSLAKDPSHLEVHEALELLEKIASFGDHSKTTEKIHALAWSSKLKIPSFVEQRASPALFVSNLWRNMPLRVAFTSATLGVARSQSLTSLAPFMAQMAISSRVVCIYKQLSPSRFGLVQYVLTDKSIPKPIRSTSELDDEGSNYSDTWLAYTVRMIGKASEMGPTLVLVGSYQEAAIIGRMLSQYKPIIHRYGHPLVDSINKFKEGESQIILTPAAWQGTSIRKDDGSQLIENLVITKIPFVPPNRTAERLAATLAARGNFLSPRKAVAYYRNAQFSQALRKLRQGMGRAIRKQTDEAVIWICDPRFPRPGETSRYKMFAEVIPDRFCDSYQDATVFSTDGESRPARKSVPEIVEEALNL